MTKIWVNTYHPGDEENVYIEIERGYMADKSRYWRRRGLTNPSANPSFTIKRTVIRELRDALTRFLKEEGD